MTARRIAGMPELKILGAKKMSTPGRDMDELTDDLGRPAERLPHKLGNDDKSCQPNKEKAKINPFRIRRRGK